MNGLPSYQGSGTRGAGSGRRARGGLIGVLLVLCFLAGLAVAGFAARRFGWFGAGRPADAASVASVQPVPSPVQPAAAPAALPALAAREAALGAQVAALEARTAAVTADMGSAGGQAARAEALLVAAAARRRVDRGEPLGYLEDQLRARFPTDRAAADLLIRAARVPVTLDALTQELDALAPGLSGGPTSETLGGRLRRELGGLVVLRRGGTPSSAPADRLGRARRLLVAGRVEAAAAELAGLPGGARAAAWQERARRYALACRALDALERAALTTPALPPDAGTGDPLRPAR